MRLRSVVLFFLVLASALPSPAQTEQRQSTDLSSWYILQAIPSLQVYSSPCRIPFSFEWEATPLLYSFGMTKLVSPWHSFFVTPPARFTGSVELKVTGDVFTRKLGTSYFGSSVQLIGHIPLLERGEDLGLNVGVAKYAYAGSSPWFTVAGVSTLFSFIELNIKYSNQPKIWLGTVEFRFF